VIAAASQLQLAPKKLIRSALTARLHCPYGDIERTYGNTFLGMPPDVEAIDRILSWIACEKGIHADGSLATCNHHLDIAASSCRMLGESGFSSFHCAQPVVAFAANLSAMIDVVVYGNTSGELQLQSSLRLQSYAKFVRGCDLRQPHWPIMRRFQETYEASMVMAVRTAAVLTADVAGPQILP
jgi:hypothetical protein